MEHDVLPIHRGSVIICHSVQGNPEFCVSTPDNLGSDYLVQVLLIAVVERVVSIPDWRIQNQRLDSLKAHHSHAGELAVGNHLISVPVKRIAQLVFMQKILHLRIAFDLDVPSPHESITNQHRRLPRAIVKRNVNVLVPFAWEHEGISRIATCNRIPVHDIQDRPPSRKPRRLCKNPVVRPDVLQRGDDYLVDVRVWRKGLVINVGHYPIARILVIPLDISPVLLKPAQWRTQQVNHERLRRLVICVISPHPVASPHQASRLEPSHARCGAMSPVLHWMDSGRINPEKTIAIVRDIILHRYLLIRCDEHPERRHLL